MNIFVSNLGFNIKDEGLKEFFTSYGEVTSSKVIMDRETNQSRGFGFVEMADETASKKAIAELDGATRDNRILKVIEARPREDRPARGNNGFNGGTSYNKNRF